jgi:hypothetical protein
MTTCGSKHTTVEGTWTCVRTLEREGSLKHEGPHHGRNADGVLMTWSTATSE